MTTRDFNEIVTRIGGEVYPDGVTCEVGKVKFFPAIMNTATEEVERYRVSTKEFCVDIKAYELYRMEIRLRDGKPVLSLVDDSAYCDAKNFMVAL